MAQNDQNMAADNTGLQLHVPGMEQFKDLEFIQSGANPADLVVKLPDGSEVVFPNYIPLAQAGAPPVITLDDGTIIPGQEIVSLIDNLNYDLIAPAAGNDTAGAVTGGGAGYTADPSGILGDDIGHGPYAGGIEISHAVEFTQVPGYDVRGGGGGGEVIPVPEEIPVISAANNVGDDYYLMQETTIDLVDRPVSSGPFGIEFETKAQDGVMADWDGMRVYLQAGETITIAHDESAPGDYYIALATDTDTTNGSDPLYGGTFLELGWEYVSVDGSINYTASGDGYVYIGTGFETGAAAGEYYTQILVNSDDGEHVGTSGGDVLVGGAGDDVITGGDGDDLLIGGSGSDEFVFQDAATDGDDTISDFSIGDGDVINLDALFDALSIPSGAREGMVNLSDNGTDTTLTIAGQPDFSVTLDGAAGLGTVADLVSSGNIVVDES